MDVARHLGDKVDAFVESFSGQGPRKVRGPKLIHDPIHGTHPLEAVEISLLDLPLLQRLRLIAQTDVASLVFPGATHTRFDHSVGTRILAGRMVDALAQCPDLKPYRTEIRLAALLHDVGHLPFSHSGETAVEAMSGMPGALKGTGLDGLSGCRLHEVLSYLVVTGEAFQDLVARPLGDLYGVDPDWELIGQMITGQVSRRELAFLGDMINGPLDADKLDYIARDSHYAGLHLGTDINRHLHTLVILDLPGGRRSLGVDLRGVHTLEQILFQRALLWATVYHHHKVRAASWMVRNLFQALAESRDPAAFLHLTDIEILAYGQPGPREWQKRLRERNLFKRALVLSPTTVVGGLSSICPGAQGPLLEEKDIRNMEKEIASQLGIRAEEVWIDLPELPWPQGAGHVPVALPGSEGPAEARALSPGPGPGQVYLENRWRGHLFTVDDDEIRRRAAHLTARVLEESLGIRLDPLAFRLAHVD